jgi:hypothetical protein
MLRAEAQWIGQALRQVDKERISPLLNVGSATAGFREEVQPWIHNEIFEPLTKRGVTVEHLDIQEGPGIDLRGDLADDSFIAGLAVRGYHALLCCNVLEHVPDPAAICAKLEYLVAVDGYLIITVPYQFPYHPDPIDTLFRPSPEEISQMFPGCRCINGDILDCGTGWDYVERNPVELISKVKRRIAGLRDHGGMRGTTSFLPWLFRTFRQTCVVLLKESSALSNA